MLKALNDQIREELSSAYLYLAMAADFEDKNLPGAAAWMSQQAQEEVAHAMKIYGYINDKGGKAVFDALPKPQESWNSMLDAFKAAYKHEQYITDCINKLVKQAREVDDTSTEIFLQWFVTEQVEEEKSTDEVVQKLQMIGDSKNGLFMIDRELGGRGAGSGSE
ncbi:MAG: ferritin [Spirochaetales bacterium]|nr:ferritin [Spirochaetales bacterium]MCF7937036.1 ferritin [Spirochaetales bacterium]